MSNALNFVLALAILAAVVAASAWIGCYYSSYVVAAACPVILSVFLVAWERK